MAPLLAGHMPVTADHTVHLSRAHAYCEQLGQGHLRDWSEMWAFGVPLGELYPVLGDLGYCTFATLGAAPPRAYAWTFAAVMFIGLYAQYALARSLISPSYPRLAGLCGVLSALLWASDLGAYREGGWVYTVVFGVWPQSLATSLAWLALLALHRAVQNKRQWRKAAVWVALALLAHPMALLHLGIVGTLWALTQREAGSAARALAPLVIGAGLCAWWWWPMLTHRVFMANYGWLFESTARLTQSLAQGQFTQNMPSLVGYAALLGIGVSLAAQRRWPKLIAACAIVLWLATSRSLFEGLRFELWGSAWTHLQYQRFLISAKPAIFALSAYGVSSLAKLLPRTWARNTNSRERILGIVLVLIGAITLGHHLPQDLSHLATRANKVRWGQWPLKRLGEHYADLDADYARFIDWAQTQATQGETLRFHAKDQRNLHWFMDLPALSGHSVYKSGFTPGDNFRHKPESRHPGLLSLLDLTHELTRVPRDRPLRDNTLRWGRIQVRPLAPAPKHRVQVFNAQGHKTQASGWLTRHAKDHWVLEIPQGQSWPITVALPIAHYARWSVLHRNQSIPTFATPAIGQHAGELPPFQHTPSGRARGQDGSQPTLLSFEASSPGPYEIRYVSSNPMDKLAFLLSVLSVVALVAIKRPPFFKLRLDRLCTAGLGIMLLTLTTTTFKRHREQRSQWLAKFDEPKTRSHRIQPGLIKSNMVIERALIARPREGDPAWLELWSDDWAPSLDLWWSLDDDRAQLKPKPAPRYELRVWLSNDPDRTPDLVHPFAHRPDRHWIRLDTHALAGRTGSLRLEIHSDHKRRTSIAVNASPSR